MYNGYMISYMSPNFETYDVIWWRHSSVNKIGIYTMFSSNALHYIMFLVILGSHTLFIHHYLLEPTLRPLSGPWRDWLLAAVGASSCAHPVSRRVSWRHRNRLFPRGGVHYDRLRLIRGNLTCRHSSCLFISPSPWACWIFTASATCLFAASPP